MRYSYKVVYASPEVLIEAGYGKVSNLPCIFDSGLAYHRNGSRFLIDRGLGLWDPKERGKRERTLPPSSQSMKNYAHRLANFLEWCDIRVVEPMKADYTQDLINRYQKEMQKGIWSAEGRELRERTINAYVGTAADFLTWAADKGLREPFFIPKVTRTIVVESATSSVSHLPKQVEARRGKLREPKRRLGFPVQHEVEAWLQRIYRKELVGPTEGLLCETILETGLRESEVAGLRLNTLPEKIDHWKIADPEVADEHQAVLVEVVFGTKGPEYGKDHGDKIGPRGTIRIPLQLAIKLHKYRETERSRALAVAIKNGRTVAEQRKIRDESVHLFLNPRTGRRYSGSNVYDVWRSVDLPQKGWCPHLGRDFWACSYLWRKIEDHRRLLEHALKTELEESIIAALKSNAQSVIELEIQPQLRHASRETTINYLQWLADRLCVKLDMHQNYVDDADDEGDGAHE